MQDKNSVSIDATAQLHCDQTAQALSAFDRRAFLRATAVAGTSVGALPLLGIEAVGNQAADSSAIPKSIIGNYGSWAASLTEQPPLSSYRRPAVHDVDTWRQAARDKTAELLAAPVIERTQCHCFSVFIKRICC